MSQDSPNILSTLAKFAHGKSAAAALIGVSRSTFYHHMILARLGTAPPKLIQLAAESALTKLMAEAQAEIRKVQVQA